jgi:NTE family protein
LAGHSLEPQARILRQPVYVWANQKRVAERFQQNLEAGIEPGRTVGNSVQIASQWHAEETHWILPIGD